jgi:hypothetical protein
MYHGTKMCQARFQAVTTVTRRVSKLEALQESFLPYDPHCAFRYLLSRLTLLGTDNVLVRIVLEWSATLPLVRN